MRLADTTLFPYRHCRTSKMEQIASMPVSALGLLVAFILYACSFLLSAPRPGPRNIPGPFWAKFSGLYMARYAMRKEFHVVFNQLHDEYGPVVRYGPHKVSIADPDALPVIFALGGGFLKVCPMALPKVDDLEPERLYRRHSMTPSKREMPTVSLTTYLPLGTSPGIGISGVSWRRHIRFRTFATLSL